MIPTGSPCLRKMGKHQLMTPSVGIPSVSSSAPQPRQDSLSKTKDLKDDVTLFSKLYIAAQDRESDLGNFFQHENHPYPLSLSDRGTLRTGTKSDLLSCLVPVPRPIPVVPEVASTSDSPGAAGTSDTPGADDETLDPCDFDDLDIDVNDRVDVLEVSPDVLESLSDIPQLLLIL